VYTTSVTAPAFSRWPTWPLGDAGITAWDAKVHYALSGDPSRRIQEGDNDGNPETVGDPNWQPLINTPNYPDYTSGAQQRHRRHDPHPCSLLWNRRNDLFGGHNQSGGCPADSHVRPLLGCAADVVNARIYEGIHFRFADVQAAQAGPPGGPVGLLSFPALGRR